MKLGKLHIVFQSISLAMTAAALASAGCSSSTAGTQLNQQPGNGVAGPHALAEITVGEMHMSGGSSSSAEVSTFFIPDASQLESCSTTIDGCTIATPAICDGVTGPSCTAEQTCVLDATCKPTCQASCTAECPTGQECYFPTPSTQSCRATQTFDAGDLIFSGTGLASGFTLFPPAYSYEGTEGNPLVPGGTIQVTSTGSAAAGFEPFQETFKATTLLQTIPSLSTLTSANVYSPAGFSVGWQPGGDDVYISVTGPLGSATCAATDAKGTFTVPAQVITTISGAGEPALSIAVERAHVEQKTDGKTQGTLAGATVQPVGYMELSSVSIETYQIEGCSTGASCNGTCVDLSTSSTNCGACGVSCGTGYCSGGTCYGQVATCSSGLSSCNGECVNLLTSAVNCGECGEVCPTGDSCVSGFCEAQSDCTTGYTQCSDGCQYLETSSTDCGECGNSCGTGTCVSGVCQTSVTTSCTTCETTAESGTCASQVTSCEDDAECSDYATCVSGCTAGDTSCVDTCISDYPNGASEAEAERTCICSTACSSQCGTTAYCTETL